MRKTASRGGRIEGVKGVYLTTTPATAKKNPSYVYTQRRWNVEP